MCNRVFFLTKLSSATPWNQTEVCVLQHYSFFFFFTIQDSQGYHKQYNYKGRTDLLDHIGENL